MDALTLAKYKHAKIIRFCKTNCEDEGARVVCNYVAINENVALLDLMSNLISPLGCEFIGKLMAPDMKRGIINLKLDHNPIGSEGMIKLADGLNQNKVIQNLSLQYCDIDETGARAIFEILIFQLSNLEEINLSGNRLRNDGVVEVLKGASAAKKLGKLNLQDNQFVEENFVLAAFEDCMRKNINLGCYNIKFNFIADYGKCN